ncbi:MAG: MopE-related protein [Archangium sp.]
MNTRAHTLAAIIGLTAGFVSACSVYNPTVRDCALQCSEDGKCPSSTTCVQGYCRVANYTGACDCNTGDSEVCGGGMGECKAGLRICLDSRIWGPCIGEVRATSELCDGKDNDCDGVIDDDPSNAPACPLNTGVCEFSVQQCRDGGFVNNCGPATYGPMYEVQEQTCDGLDNDCDGNADSRPAVKLLDNINKWTAVAVSGGYFVFWTEVTDTNLHVQRFDDLLRPVNDAGVVVTGAVSIATFDTRVSNGTVAAVGFTRNDSTIGVVRVSTTEDPLLLDNPSGPINSFSIGVTSAGIVRAAYDRDGGLLLGTWQVGGTALSTTSRPFRLPATRISNLKLSDDATILAWDGDYDDGGSSDSTGAVEQVEGSLVVPRSGQSYNTLVTTPGRVQGFDTFSSYFPFAFPLAINESGLSYCPDVLQVNGSCTSINRVQDYQQIHDGRASRLGNDMITGWIDNGSLWVGIALPTVSQIRMRRLDMAGFVADFDLAAPPGSNFMTVFYRTQGAPTSIFGTLLCPP